MNMESFRAVDESLIKSVTRLLKTFCKRGNVVSNVSQNASLFLRSASAVTEENLLSNGRNKRKLRLKKDKERKGTMCFRY